MSIRKKLAGLLIRWADRLDPKPKVIDDVDLIAQAVDEATKTELPMITMEETLKARAEAQKHIVHGEGELRYEPVSHPQTPHVLNGIIFTPSSDSEIQNLTKKVAEHNRNCLPSNAVGGYLFKDCVACHGTGLSINQSEPCPKCAGKSILV